MESVRALPICKIEVIEAGSPVRSGWGECVIGNNIVISPETLEAYCLSGWDPVVFDALLLAAAVEYGDRLKTRPAGGWARSFHLAVPVHDPSRWGAPAVAGSLRRVLQTVTGDRFELTFKPRKTVVSPPAQSPLNFGDSSCAVIPFSDGLDSRAVAGLTEKLLGDKLIHVRLGSKQIDRPERDGRPLPFTAIPYQVRGRFNETSCRSRGFKFATISGLAAHLSGARRIIVPESGQGALGPVLVPVMHGQPDYRNHPAFTRQMEAFLKALLGSPVRYEFPRLWYTKGQTLRSFVEAGGKEWDQTRSCWQRSRHMSVHGKLRQCGFCAACLLRRLSIHAAGLTESSSTYMLESLSSETLDAGMANGFTKLIARQRRYADAAVLHLDYLAEFQELPRNAAALRRHVAQLSEALSTPATEALGSPATEVRSTPAAEVEVNLRKMLLEHQREWKAFCATNGDNSFIAVRSALAA